MVSTRFTFALTGALFVYASGMLHGQASPPTPPAPHPVNASIDINNETTSRVFYLYYYRDAERVAEILRGRTLVAPVDTHHRDRLEKTEADLTTAVGKRSSADAAWRGAVEDVQAESQVVDPVTKVLSAPSTNSVAARNAQAASLAEARATEESLRKQRFLLQSTSMTDPALTAGDPHSDDPVGRVTISVVGAGILHLHGPVKGVNLIARMIHEIDRPVGQVKVGLHSIQFELPTDQDVERAHDMIDEHVRHARLLTQRSEELFRRAFAETTTKLGDVKGTNAAQHILCRQFFDEMETDSTPGQADPASLIVKSLNSLDLIGCMYLTALVEDSTRREILAHFDEHVERELVPLDVAYYRRLYEASKQDTWRRGMYHGCFPESKGELDLEAINETVRQNMTFPNIHRLLANQQCSETLNNVQLATLSLVKVARSLEEAQLELASLKSDQMLLLRSSSVQRASLSPGNTFRTEDFLLDRYIDQESTSIVDIREQLRASIASVDSELTQMAIAFEDDISSQFYRRAMRNIRRAADVWKIRMEQVESTTIITGDRTPARVSPGQTLEFELPDRQILAKEILDGASALALESEGLARRFSVRAAAQSVGPAGTAVADSLGLTAPGTSLQQLVPPERNYSVEAGNDLHITPIIQPDGKSIAYRLVYPYRAIVNAPPGSNQSSRVVRHYIDTEVQTTAYELREISRFRVGIQATKGTRGVPILEDIPGAGRLFRSRPSRATTVQDTMMLADCVIYPSILSVTGTNWFDPRPKGLDNRGMLARDAIQRDGEIRQEVLSNTRSRVTQVLQAAGLEVPSPLPSSVSNDVFPVNELPVSPEDCKPAPSAANQEGGVVQAEAKANSPPKPGSKTSKRWSRVQTTFKR